MVEPGHRRLSIVRQCGLLSISRSTFYYQAKGDNPLNLKLMRLIDEQFLKTPWYGSRQMARRLRLEGYEAGRKRIRRLMRKMGDCGGLPEAPDQRAAPGAQGVSLSVAQSVHQDAG